MQPLSDRQAAVLQWIAVYFAEHDESPTLRELAEGLEMSSAAAYDFLLRLESRGMIVREYRRARALTITPAGFDEMNVPAQPPPPPNTRRCARCHHRKDIKEFYKKPTGAQGRDNVCIFCSRQATTDRRQRQSNKVVEVQRQPSRLCKVCFGLPHRVEGAVCSCGLRRAA